MINNKFWTKEEENVIENNHGKLTLPQINTLLEKAGRKISYYALRSKTQRMGFFRNKTQIRLPIKIKNKHNEDYFKIPNLINSFLAGMIASDGCIHKLKAGGYKFGYKVAIKDESIINLLKKEFNYNGEKIYTSSKSPHSDNISYLVEIQINCFDKNAAYLRQHFNLIENKTKRLGPTNLNNDILNLSYLIGITDGDGTIGYIPRKNKPEYDTIYWHVASSSSDIIQWAKTIVDKIFPADIYSVFGRESEMNYHKKCHYYRYSIAGLRAAVFIDYLSQFPVPKLKRKWENPLILDYICAQKEKYPHLFKKVDLSNYIIPISSVNNKECILS